MFLGDLFFALIVALALSLLFVSLLGWRGSAGASPGGTFAFFFAVVLFAAWAGGLWLAPFGPVWWGAGFLPFLAAGLVVALILAAALPPRRGEARRSAPVLDDRTRTRESEGAPAAVVLGGFFWALVVVLGAAVAVAYIA
jgi:hypothetical protein